MTRAYAENYVNDAMKNLGEAFDYAVNGCGLTPDAFMELFVASGYADAFGKGNAKVVSGLSGTELVIEVVSESGKAVDFPDAQIEYDASPEYWSGWVLAFYQWYTARSFKDIHNNISIREILKLYPTHHEASEEKFVETVNAIIKRRNSSTKLQSQRKRCGFSQRELSRKAGVNIRTLQQYEIGTKNINKASVQAILSLARVLGCKAEDLLEPRIEMNP